MKVIVWFGLAVVLAAAAVLSFDGLRGLALTVRVAPDLAWLLPIAVDAGAAVSCATWLGRRTTPDASRYAGRMTWALLAVTVVGNAGHLGMHAGGIDPPWWVAVLVGAIAPAVVGATVHLIVLVGRPDATRPTDELPTTADQAATGEAGDDEAELPDRRDAVDTSSISAICSDLQAIAGEHGRPLTQDEVRAVYGIGAEKAGKVRRQLGWWPRAVGESERAEVLAR